MATKEQTIQVLKDQLRQQYDALVTDQNYKFDAKYEPQLEKMYSQLANYYYDSGLTSIYDIERRQQNASRGVTAYSLYNKKTGQPLKGMANFEIHKDVNKQPKKGVKYGEWTSLPVFGSGHFAIDRGYTTIQIHFTEEGFPIFVPIYVRQQSDWEKFRQALPALVIGNVLPTILSQISSALGVSGTVANLATGAAIGATGSALAGQDPIKGAIRGAIGSITSTTYAEGVGKSLGVTSQTAAITVGNAVINAGLSGVLAAVTGGNVVKSMLGGAVKGAIIADAAVLANALVGGEANLQRLISGTNLNLEQAQQIITRSIGDAFALSIQGGNFFNLLGEGLVANGISTSVANGINSAIGKNLSDEARMALVVGGQGISDVTVRAVLNNRSISNDLSRASANIVSAALIAANMTASEKARLDELRKNQTVLDSPPLTQVLLASANTGTMSDAINELGIDGVIQYTNGITAFAPEIIVKGSWLDGWLNTVTSIWNDFSSFLGQYASYQKDNVIRTVIGLANISQSIYGVGGAGPSGVLSTNIEALERVKQSLTKLLSAEATGNRAEAYRILKEAEGTGRLNELLSGFRAFAQDPSGFFSEGLGSVIPNLIGGSIASGASLTGRLATQLGINIPGAVGNVKREIYDEVYQSARKAGLSNVDAVAMATDAQSYTGRNTDAIALAAAIGGIATLIPGSLEQQIIKRVAAQSAAKVAIRAVTAGAVEKVTEFVQSLQAGISANVAINRIPDPRIEMIRQAGVNSEIGREIQRQIDAMPWNRGLLDENVLGKAVLEAITAFTVGAALSVGLSYNDLVDLAIDSANKRGQPVNWEVLDAPTRSDLIIKAFVPPEIIDVVATDVTKLLTAPPPSDADTGGGTVLPALPGPSDQNIIDVIDTGPNPITPAPAPALPAPAPAPALPAPAPAPALPAPAPAPAPAGPTPEQIIEQQRIAEEQARIAEQERIAREQAERARLATEQFDRVRGQESEILTQVDDPTIQVITTIQNDIDLLMSNRNTIIDIFQNLDDVTRQELEPVFQKNDQDLQQKIIDLTLLQDIVIGDVRTELTDTARGRRQELDIERFEREQEEFDKALKELEDEIAKAESDAEKTRARQLFTTQQREKLQAAGRITGGLQAQINAELNDLLDQYEDAQRRGRVSVTQKEGLVAPQQPDPNRPITDEEIIRLTGITPDDASRIRITVPPTEEITPPDVTESTDKETSLSPVVYPEDEQPPPEDEDKVTPLSPLVIYNQPRPRGTPGIPSRVTPEAVTGILGPKEPIFGSDRDPQVALWNRRSLRLRKALGL